MMIDADVCTEANCAMSVVATVVSAPVPERIILDAGSKALTSDIGGLENFGALQDYPDAKIYKINEEHGMVDVSACDPKPQVGELVRILPNHVCPVSNLFDRVMIQEKDGSYAWLTIDARGY
jgi:D-serine deaminase-like pyridoxal phosphate-dependent protein